MRLVLELAARAGDRIGARAERPRQRAQMIGGQRDRKVGDQVDELAAGNPLRRFALREQRLDVLVAGFLHVGFQRLERERGDVTRL